MNVITNSSLIKFQIIFYVKIYRYCIFEELIRDLIVYKIDKYIITFLI